MKDGYVTIDEFVNYYTNMSAFIDDDDYFDSMIRNVWSTGQPFMSRSDGNPRHMDFLKAPAVVSGDNFT